jgi:hypothetical protein
MNPFLDYTLVALALLASAGYALASLGPKGLRVRMLRALAHLAAHAPKFLPLERIARRWEEAATGKASGACGGCGSCGSDSSEAERAPSTDIRVPVAKIGRRT